MKTSKCNFCNKIISEEKCIFLTYNESSNGETKSLCCEVQKKFKKNKK